MAEDRSYTIRLSAVLDKSTAAVGQPLEDSVRRARKRVEGDAAAMGAALAAAGRRGAEAAAVAAEVSAARVARAEAAKAAAAVKAANVMAIATANAEKKRSDAEGKAFDERLRRQQREHAQTEAYLAKKIAEVKRETDAVERAEGRKAKAKQKGRGASGSSSFVSESFTNMHGLASAASHAAMNVAGTFARGAGANFDIGSYITKIVEAQTQAIDIINQSKLAGHEHGPGDAKALEGNARGVAKENHVGTGDVLGIVRNFQAKSDDIETAQKAMGGLAKLAQAAGANFDDVGKAAGVINSQLADTPDRAERLLAIMRNLAGAAASGQVELKEFAAYMPRLAGSANLFKGTFEEGMAELSAFTQLAMKGTASTASEATNAAASLGRDLKKGSTVKAFARLGVDVWADEGHTKLRGPEALALETLDKTHGDRGKIQSAYKNTAMGRTMDYVTTVYDDAEGKQKGSGRAAVQTELKKYHGELSASKVDSLAAEKAESVASKAADFNNALEGVVAEVSATLLPALVQLSPHVIQLAEMLGKLTTMAVDNPGAAIEAAIVASIAKAAIGQAISSAISSVLGAAGGIAIPLIAIATATVLIKNKIDDTVGKGDTAAKDQDVAVGNATRLLEAALKDPKATEEQRTKAFDEGRKQEVVEQRRIANAESPAGLDEVLNPFSGRGIKDLDQGKNDAAHIGQIKADLARLHDAITAGFNKKQIVHVENMPANGPSIPAGGRRGIGG